jgi:hypothetical protein
VGITKVSPFHLLSRGIWIDSRMTGALVDWLKEYPGDLCDAEATRLFKAILALVVDYFFMAHLTVELSTIEDGIPIYEDLDASWSIKPGNPSAPEPVVPVHEVAAGHDSLYDLDIMSPTEVDDNDNDNGNDTDTPLGRLPPSTGNLLVDEEASVIMERRLSGSDSRVALSSQWDKRSLSFGIPSAGDHSSEWQAAVAWVMNNDPLEFAAELTRMSWDLFVTIRVSLVTRMELMKGEGCITP